MKFLNRSLITDKQWKAYKQLELIPESIPLPTAPLPLFGLSLAWKTLLSLLAEELVDDQQVDYLERCLALDEFGYGEKSPDNSLQRLWTLMD
jgi:hypothetical protein